MKRVESLEIVKDGSKADGQSVFASRPQIHYLSATRSFARVCLYKLYSLRECLINFNTADDLKMLERELGAKPCLTCSETAAIHP